MTIQITSTQSSYIHSLAHIPGTCALISSSCALFPVAPQPQQVTASHPSPVIIHQSAVRKNAGPSENGTVKLDHLHMHQGSPLLPIFRALSRSLTIIIYDYYIIVSFDRRIFDLSKDHLVSRKKQKPFGIAIGIVELMHECFPKYLRTGTARLK